MKIPQILPRLAWWLATFSLIELGGADACAQVNSWTNPVSGNWEDLKWSLGTQPSANDAVMITNENWKAVSINPGTVANFPGSMTISNLTIAAPTGSKNTLLLNYAGDTVPLHVARQFVVGSNGVLAMFDSALEVPGYSGTLCSVQGEVAQTGGRSIVTPGLLLNGQFNLTNGYAQSAGLGIGDNGSFTQVGGSNSTGTLVIGYNGTGVGDNPIYTLVNGRLDVGQNIVGNAWAFASFVQLGGTNRSSTLRVGDYGYMTFGGAYDLAGGRLETQSTTVSSPRGPHHFSQSGGTHQVDGPLVVQGNCVSTYLCSKAVYSQDGGTLLANSMTLNFCYFSQGGGIANIRGDVSMNGSGGLVPPGGISITGGLMGCANFDGRSGYFDLNGGLLMVSNLFKFTGFDSYCPPCVPPAAYARFTLRNGSLVASNLQIGALMALAPGRDRITNDGVFALSGFLSCSNATERLGRFVLSGRELTGAPTIVLSGATNVITFADSRSEAWTNTETLFITGWGGSTNGGGADQIQFGTNASALTATQLNQIYFVNPDGFPPGTCKARILGSGEVVPIYQSTLYPALVGNDLVLTWSNATSVQTATNVSGPFSNVPGATSPFTNNLPYSATRFFRLQQ